MSTTDRDNRFSRLFPTLIAALAAASALALAGVGCGGDEGTEGDDTCYDYSGFSAGADVSFKTDVLPIFRNSCGLSTACHGNPSGPTEQPYLGPAMGPAITDMEIMAIFTDNVGVASAKAPSMKIVDPGSPQTSFLMAKVDDKLTCSTVKCDTTCGTSMPQGAPLPEDKRDIIRRWIAQGAKNN